MFFIKVRQLCASQRSTKDVWALSLMGIFGCNLIHFWQEWQLLVTTHIIKVAGCKREKGLFWKNDFQRRLYLLVDGALILSSTCGRARS